MRILVLITLSLSLSACKQGEGGVCQVTADCSDGLVCNQQTGVCQMSAPAVDSAMVCTPNDTQACYTGPMNTEGVGLCMGGTQTCANDGSAWGSCMGEVVPTTEVCGNADDEDCSGMTDDLPDTDGDGFNECMGDCCEVAADCNGADPATVNPNAMDGQMDGVDNDCNPATPD